MKKPKLVAFMSYVRSDDTYGHLTKFRDRLSAEVRMQTGEEFSIFQDRNDVLWGQNWKDRIEDSIDEVTFLIPIITPSFFKSQPCRDELQRFLEREKKLKRNDLILPVYYIDCPLLNDENKRTTDKLAQVIAARQYVDWRDLRFEPFTSPLVGKTLAQLAVQIRDALERVQTPQKKTTPKPAQLAPRHPIGEPSPPIPQATEFLSEIGEIIPRPSAKTEPPTRVVDPMHHGDHLTITEAIETANPGDRILVRPGLYKETLVIKKPLEIIGSGDPSEVVVQSTGKSALLFQSTMGRVSNLTLRQLGGEKYATVDIAQGRLELEGCDITSQTTIGFGYPPPCVAIHAGADPHLRRNRIHDSDDGGVYISDNGQGTLEDNEIFSNTLSGVTIVTGGNPKLRRNRIFNNKHNGVLIQMNGQGMLEDNNIFGNGIFGVDIHSGSSPMLRYNRINNNRFEAVAVYEGGSGTIEDNDLRGNGSKGAWRIHPKSDPKLKRARNKE